MSTPRRTRSGPEAATDPKLLADVNPLRRRRAVSDERQLDRSPESRTAALTQQVARGDADAFAGLYDELAPLVHGIVLRVVRDPSIAEEVSQEALLEVWRQASRYDASKGSVRSWAATIAHRRAVDRVRAEQARRHRDDRVGRMGTPADDVVADVEDRLDRERVVRALGQLTGLQRQSVELAYYGGHTYREVAALLDLPEGTVKTRIRDGLIRLRDTLGVTP